MENKIFSSAKKSTPSEVKCQNNADFFFYIKDIVRLEFITKRPTINQVFYENVLIRLREKIRKNAQKNGE